LVHGNARISGNTQVEYVRTKPKVLERIHTGLANEGCKPRDVYTTLTTDDDSFTKLIDHKQVRNVAQRVANTSASGKQPILILVAHKNMLA